MTPEEEKRAKAAANKRAYRQRKKAELEELARQTPDKERERLFNEQARNIAPELEEQFSKAAGNATIHPFPPGVLYKDNHKDELADMLAASEERGRRTALIMSMYERDAASTNKLLWHILETLTRMRLEIVDLVGGLRNGK